MHFRISPPPREVIKIWKGEWGDSNHVFHYAIQTFSRKTDRKILQTVTMLSTDINFHFQWTINVDKTNHPTSWKRFDDIFMFVGKIFHIIF